jgi:hypothetical protein
MTIAVNGVMNGSLNDNAGTSNNAELSNARRCCRLPAYVGLLRCYRQPAVT